VYRHRPPEIRGRRDIGKKLLLDRLAVAAHREPRSCGMKTQREPPDSRSASRHARALIRATTQNRTLRNGSASGRKGPTPRKDEHTGNSVVTNASNLARMVQIMWGEWTGITEISNRVSVSGGGKSDLDGRFAFLGMALRKGVNAGASHWSAETTMAAAIKMGDMAATVCATFMPVRPESTPAVLTKGMEAFHHCELVLHDDKSVHGLRVHYVSGFGAGRLVPLVSGGASKPPLPPQPHIDLIDLSQSAGMVNKIIKQQLKAQALVAATTQMLWEYELTLATQQR
jgi:hypothetical protein